MLRHIIYIYTVTSTLAQTPDVPHGGGSCDPAQNGWDCSLGGVCNTSQVCQCDAWFTGPTCALLNLQAPDDDQGGSCGSGFASYYSWGGRALEGSDGKFHASISFLCRHASLSEWTSVSSSAHMVADSPAGRYTWGGEQCVGEICTPSIVPWSHNTVLLEDDDAGAQKYQIWHVGDSSADPSKWSPCFNFSEVGTPLALPRPAAAQRSPTQPSPGNAAYVATGPSLSGPWTKWDNNGQIGINFTGSWTNSLAGNPAPLVMPDGSINLYFTAVPCPPNSGAKASNCIAVASSPTWEGPFQMRAAQHPITYPESEDPSVFRDPRGNYHLLTNVNTCHQRCAQGVECGGHAWSRDGFLFSNLTIGAFGPYITFRNGSTWANAYVERPLVTQDATGRPIALYLGMGRKAYEDCCNWPQLFCTGAEGEACGPTLTPSPPAPKSFRLQNAGQCLSFNLSGYPCSGGGGAAGGCPLVMGPCTGSASLFSLTDSSGKPTQIVSAGLGGKAALDVDCSSSEPHTLVKILNSGWSTFSVEGSRIEFAGKGMCLNTGQGPPKPPCGPKGELYFDNQIQLISCSDASAQGWSLLSAEDF